MKISLPLKLGIAVIVFFAVTLGAMFAYGPVKQAWIVRNLGSGDPAVRENAAKSLAAEGEKVIPLLKRWLGSENPEHVRNACRVAAEIKGDVWKELTEYLGAVLDEKPSGLTDAAAAVFLAHNNQLYDLLEAFDESPARRRSLLCYLLTHYNLQKKHEEDDHSDGVI